MRGGVAPDHPKIKQVIKTFKRSAMRPAFRFLGHVAYGRDLHLAELLQHYHQVLFCTGCEHDQRLGIPGEDLPGSHPATAFVGWYNGHPDYRTQQFELNGKAAAVIGHGNVAMDVTRILARTPEELSTTDIAEHALEALRHSSIATIHLLGRRGPAQAAFTNPEIRELTNLPAADLRLRPQDLDIDPLSARFLAEASTPQHQRNVDILRAHEQGLHARGIPKEAPTQAAASQTQARRCQIQLRFFVSPQAILGEGRVEALRIVRNVLIEDEQGRVRAQATSNAEELPVQLVFRSIGYRGEALPDLPFDPQKGTIPHEDGLVRWPSASALSSPTRVTALSRRVYVAGWIKRGPTGVIGTNKADAIASVKHMLQQLATTTFDGQTKALAPSAADPEAVLALLSGRGVRVVDFADWETLDALEIAAGTPRGKPREKFTRIPAMLQALESAPSSV